MIVYSPTFKKRGKKRKPVIEDDEEDDDMADAEVRSTGSFEVVSDVDDEDQQQEANVRI